MEGSKDYHQEYLDHPIMQSSVHNAELWQHLESLALNTAQISHEAFKQQCAQAKVIIRTGEATPYANIILQSGVIF